MSVTCRLRLGLEDQATVFFIEVLIWRGYDFGWWDDQRPFLINLFILKIIETTFIF